VPIKPWFLEKPDPNHVTLLGAITLSGYSLRPVPLSTRLHLLAEIANSEVAGEFCDTMMPKGYLTSDVMNFRIDHVLLPYIQDVRSRLTNLSTAILIIDGLRSHITPYAGDMFETRAIHVLELPTHHRSGPALRFVPVWGNEDRLSDLLRDSHGITRKIIEKDSTYPEGMAARLLS
jgi:hypothetical protein